MAELCCGMASIPELRCFQLPSLRTDLRQRRLEPTTKFQLNAVRRSLLGRPGTAKVTNPSFLKIPEHMRGGSSKSKGELGFDRATHRTGPLCTPAFAMTDLKNQGKQFSQVLLNLKCVHGSSAATTGPTFMSLYVQLSRAERWEGPYLFRKPAQSDFIEPKNELDRET